MTNPFTRTQMESYSKNDSGGKNLRAASSLVHWTLCTKYYYFFFLKRTTGFSELRALRDVDVFQGRQNSHRSCVTVIMIHPWWKLGYLWCHERAPVRRNILMIKYINAMRLRVRNSAQNMAHIQGTSVASQCFSSSTLRSNIQNTTNASSFIIAAIISCVISSA